jgi:hypothetical protein
MTIGTNIHLNARWIQGGIPSLGRSEDDIIVRRKDVVRVCSLREPPTLSYRYSGCIGRHRLCGLITMVSPTKDLEAEVKMKSMALRDIGKQ